MAPPVFVNRNAAWGRRMAIRGSAWFTTALCFANRPLDIRLGFIVNRVQHH